jgi:hypothetical protein
MIIHLSCREDCLANRLPKLTSLLMVFICIAADAPAKPKIKVAEDGFPAGQLTPEGAACDLARAIIKHDDSLFIHDCIRLYANGKGPEDYAAFLQQTVQSIKQEAARKEPSPAEPKAIGKTFAARHLSSDSQASYGYAAFGFQDIMFVDVGVFLHSGKHSLNRTMVIKDKDGKWYAHPLPSAGSGLLSQGLNNEKPSETDFTDVYDVQK